MLAARMKGGPLHGTLQALPGNIPNELRAVFVEPTAVRWLAEDEPMPDLTTVFYECVYKASRRLSSDRYEYLFTSIEPKAETRLRRKIRLEELTAMQSKIDSLAKANFELSLRLEEYEEDIR